MSAAQTLRRNAGWVARDVLIRLRLVAYQPLVWSPELWNSAYTERSTDGYADLGELSRYSLLVGYLRSLGPVGDVVDVGCGAGVLRQRAEGVPFERWIGLDLVEAAITQAQQLPAPRSEFRVASVGDLEPGSADVAICNEVLYMTPNPVGLLEDVERVLRPGGHLLTSIWRHPGDAVLWREIDKRFQRLDHVRVRNAANALAPRGWRVALHRRELQA